MTQNNQSPCPVLKETADQKDVATPQEDTHLDVVLIPDHVQDLMRRKEDIEMIEEDHAQDQDPQGVVTMEEGIRMIEEETEAEVEVEAGIEEEVAEIEGIEIEMIEEAEEVKNYR